MTHLRSLKTAAGAMRYRVDLTGEILAWVLFVSDGAFSPAHPVLNHKEDGPIIIVGGEVFEIDDEPIYGTKEQALTAYYQE